MSGATRLTYVRKHGRLVQVTVYQEDTEIERMEGPKARYKEIGRNHHDDGTITLPRIRALDHVQEDAPAPIRFAPKSAPIDPIKMRNLAMIRRVGQMLQRSGGA
jgi:hypothetical protein